MGGSLGTRRFGDKDNNPSIWGFTNRNSSVNLGFPESELGVPGIWGPKNAGLGSGHLGSLESKVKLGKLGSPVGRIYGSENEGVPGGRVTGPGIWDGGQVGVLEVGGQKEVKVWVRPPAPGCPKVVSHRPGVPEGHAR